MGGEKAMVCEMVRFVWGSPPRGRGKDVTGVEDHRNVRITPAWAGKSAESSGASGRERDHPRVGGEKEYYNRVLQQLKGSPPRRRGKAVLVHPYHHRPGITPARAGKRCERQAHTYTARDHPRMGGEKSTSMPQTWRPTGSPPRGRGKACPCTPQAGYSRIHPRVGGEKANGSDAPDDDEGSPPRGRGKGGPRAHAGRLCGITPA